MPQAVVAAAQLMRHAYCKLLRLVDVFPAADVSFHGLQAVLAIWA